MAGNIFNTKVALSSADSVFKGLGSIIKQNRQEQKAIQKKQAFMGALESGDPNKMAEFVISNPDSRELVNDVMKYKSTASKKNHRDTLRNILTDPQNAGRYISDRKSYLESVGANTDITDKSIEMYQQNPESFMKNAEVAFAGVAPREFKALFGKGGGGVATGNKAFQPVTLINPKTKEKMLASPIVDKQTGKATLSRFDIPEGFEISRETPSEKRAANIIAEGEKAAKKATSKGIAARRQTSVDDGIEAAEGYSNVIRGIDLLNGLETGGIDNIALKAKQLFGIEGADEAELSNRLGKAVLSQLKATFGSAFTEGEGRRLSDIEAGFGKSTEGNRRLLNQTKRIIERAAKRGIRAANAMGDHEAAREIQESLDFRLDINKPEQAPQPQQLPPQNQQGWGLMTDANGNKAYVGPNGEIEEVQ